ncbi:hypothetical protein [Natronolimnohabitans innermongolicus]|uniref:Uncharacterized protein n=1 Tax=Natronolimnohabitans innermongolicus JCM 12255 TaxID=1227499 RepID=L9WXR0_9EURY|nr:hypothetical protein [Natronolimnohabitans innermongolicus]ELY54259.1 hypothetical protein C493_12943 [Natronolimnohabitans innermongolicus JCM 12255]
MKGPGILWMLQTAAGMSMAGPMFFLGLESLRTARYTWAGFYLALGLVVLYFPTYLVNRIGGPRTWIRRRLGRGGDDEAKTEADDPDGTEPSADRNPSSTGRLLERLRRR